METRGCASSLVIPLYYTSNIQIKEYITGYLVFISDNIINNFGEYGKVFYNRIKHIFAFLIESFKMRREASIDKLTSVLTRKYIETAFDDLVNISKANNKPFSILMYDLDHFKKVNDIFGHQSGDAVLKATADVVLKALKKKLRGGKTPPRYPCHHLHSSHFILFTEPQEAPRRDGRDALWHQPQLRH